MKAVKVLVLTGYGLNCDRETAHAFEQAGAVVRRVHINALIEKSAALAGYQMLVFGGGFSWADDHGAGVIQAVRLKTHLGAEVRRFIADGNLIFGICNGFQTLVNFGLLPGFEMALGPDGAAVERCAALTVNDCGNFRDEWVRLRFNPQSPCIFTRDMTLIDLPVRHGEGKFFAQETVLQRLAAGNQVVARYAAPDGSAAAGRFPYNPNGSLDDIAGICDPSGRVFGLMPHPEAYNHWTNHPDWHAERQAALRRGRKWGSGMPPGIRMLHNAVQYLQAR